LGSATEALLCFLFGGGFEAFHGGLVDGALVLTFGVWGEWWQAGGVVVSEAELEGSGGVLLRQGVLGYEDAEAVGDVVAGGFGAAEVLGERGPVWVLEEQAGAAAGEVGGEAHPALCRVGGLVGRPGRGFGWAFGEALAGAAAGVFGPGGAGG